jgi:hypothetical protein
MAKRPSAGRTGRRGNRIRTANHAVTSAAASHARVREQRYVCRSVGSKIIGPSLSSGAKDVSVVRHLWWRAP